MRDSEHVDRQHVSVTFGVRGDSLVPAELSQLLGMQPSHSFAKGDEYASATGNRKRPWGVWQLRSDASVRSENLEEHVRFILDQLEPKREIISGYVNSGQYYVDVRIWYESVTDTISFVVPSGVLGRLAALCREINFSILSRSEPRLSVTRPNEGAI